jgi:anti-anti-sigma factor
MNFHASVVDDGDTATITMTGDLDASTVQIFKDCVELIDPTTLRRLVLDMSGLKYISSAGLRQLVFARQKMDDAVRMVLVGANDYVTQTIRLVGFDHSVTFAERAPEQS